MIIGATLFLIRSGEPFIHPAGHSWENSAFYLMAGSCLALTGAGRWSLGAWLFGANENNRGIANGAGFPTHAHRDMEIITYAIHNSKVISAWLLH